MIKIFKKIIRGGINQFEYLGNNILGKRRCPVCGNKIIKYQHFDLAYLDEYFKYQLIHPITALETFNVIGYSCPICHTNDSTRLYALYLSERLGALEKLEKDLNLLDIAPTARLAQLIKSFKKVKYRSADLYMTGVDDQVDVTDMAIYPDGYFDLIICTHVLEHVQEDRRALQELFRILKIGGEAIIQVPILMTITEDYENESAVTAEDRWKHYGESTHVRFYSKPGFVSKLAAAGFTVLQLGREYFGKEVFKLNSLAETSVLYVVKK